jgi:hypothetical protein
MAKKHFPLAFRASADKYPGLYDENGDLDQSLLSLAHGYCFRSAINALDGDNDVVVDNTNTRIHEISPYVLLAQAFGAEVELVQVRCPVRKAFERNVHKVPFGVVERMALDVENAVRSIPPWWPAPKVINNG